MKKARSSGFTIVEVMIVLAVTGLLFLGAAALISGRTDQTEFDQATRALQQQMQDTVNEVSAGNYTGTTGSNKYTCSAAGGTIVFNPGGAGQGTNQDCIFIGKLIEFGLGTNQDSANVYTLAGVREVQPSGDEVTSLATAEPQIVTLGNGQLDVANIQLEYGLHTYAAGGASSMNYSLNSGGLVPIGAMALVYSFASYGAGGTIVSGSQQVNVVPLSNSQLGEGQGQLISDVKNKLAGSPDATSGMQVSICVASGTTNQYAVITIGGSNNGQLGVTLSIIGAKNGTTCP
jgi:prepilin-type N-terminal cleavage/methylation domain-containing protein